MRISAFWPMLLLAAPLAACAQAPASGIGFYQAEYDSLLARQGRVRRLVESRPVELTRHSFAALGGTSRRIRSYARLRVRNSDLPGSKSIFRLCKRHVVKHKTHGAEVEKVFYYDLNGQLLLAEYYEGHQPVRLYLAEYGPGPAYRRTEWVRGDYLRLTQRGPTGRPVTYYYSASRENQ